MAVGNAQSSDGTAVVQLYTSPDFATWTYANPLFSVPGAGMFECPGEAAGAGCPPPRCVAPRVSVCPPPHARAPRLRPRPRLPGAVLSEGGTRGGGRGAGLCGSVCARAGGWCVTAGAHTPVGGAWLRVHARAFGWCVAPCTRVLVGCAWLRVHARAFGWCVAPCTRVLVGCAWLRERTRRWVVCDCGCTRAGVWCVAAWAHALVGGAWPRVRTRLWIVRRSLCGGAVARGHGSFGTHMYACDDAWAP
jgi:hypothetical protein